VTAPISSVGCPNPPLRRSEQVPGQCLAGENP
jgi:hypothetical protein